MITKMRGAKPRLPIYSGVGGMLARVVDAAVGMVAPAIAHRMRVSRIKNGALLAYEAATITRLNPSVPTTSADSDLLQDVQRLRDMARTMVRDDPHAASAVQVLEENIVGDGIVPQSCCTAESTGMSDDACLTWNAACEAEWQRWECEVADATRNGTFCDLQRLALRSLIVDGEILAHAVTDGVEIGCELIDSDRLESPGWSDTDTMRRGVEFDGRGRAIAYHILPRHRQDLTLPGTSATLKPIRIDRMSGGLSLVQHVFKRQRPGQSRGVPALTPALPFFRHLHHYLDSELIAARAASNYALFIKRAVSTTDADIFPVVDNEQASGVQYLESLEAGTIEYLNEGEEPVPFAPNRPGAQFDMFVSRILRAICASMGLSIELVTRDFASMNYSSARALLLECRRGFDMVRSEFCERFLQPWWKNVMQTAIANGRLTAPPGFLDDPDCYMQVRWVAPAYGWVDPTKEIEAAVNAINANLSTPYDEAARAGLDAEDVLRSRARFLNCAKKIETEFGLDPGVLTSPTPLPGMPMPSSTPATDPADGSGGDSGASVPVPVDQKPTITPP